MAATFEAAFAAAESPELDLAVRYVVPPRKWVPADEVAEAACRGLRYGHVIDRLAAYRRCDRTRAEDAVQDALEALLIGRPEIFRDDPESWMKLLFTEADFRLRRSRDQKVRTVSVEGLSASAGDVPFGGARRCVPPTLDCDCYRQVSPPKMGEEWNRTQVIGAIQRFHAYYRQAPKAADFNSVNKLPSLSVVYRHFDDLSSASLAAGIVPDAPRRRRAWRPVEAAKACLSFRWRYGHWPTLSDVRRNPGELPGREAMIKYFGGTRPAEVQQGAELILAAVGIST